MKRLRPKHGYWDTTGYPLGGCFRRAPSDGLVISEVIRTFPMTHGANEEGRTASGATVCYDSGNCQPLGDGGGPGVYGLDADEEDAAGIL